jgi:uncharacterized alpha-E superfamily protein
MLSRVAERMYWAGRYLERVESTARLINTYTGLLLDLPADAGIGWQQVLRIVAAEDLFNASYNKPTEDSILRFLLADADYPGSILSSLSCARENIRTSRDIVPSEGWECINQLFLMARDDLGKAVGRRRRYKTLSDCVARCQQITGLLSGTMSHGYAYNFLRLGLYLERADMGTRVVDVAAATLAGGDPRIAPYENTLWMAVLKSLSGYQMYRQNVRRRVNGSDVVNFLLTDRQFPRALGYNLNALDRSLATLPDSANARKVVAKLDKQISSSEVAELGSAELHAYIDRLQLGFGQLHLAVQGTWFLIP